MEISVQIFSLVYSFFMGVLLYIISLVNYRLIGFKKGIIKYACTLLLIIDFNLIYLVGLYHINYGIIHFYFIVLVIIGFSLAVKIVPRVIKSDNYFNL